MVFIWIQMRSRFFLPTASCPCLHAWCDTPTSFLLGPALRTLLVPQGCNPLRPLWSPGPSEESRFLGLELRPHGVFLPFSATPSETGEGLASAKSRLCPEQLLSHTSPTQAHLVCAFPVLTGLVSLGTPVTIHPSSRNQLARASTVSPCVRWLLKSSASPATIMSVPVSPVRVSATYMPASLWAWEGAG